MKLTKFKLRSTIKLAFNRFVPKTENQWVPEITNNWQKILTSVLILKNKLSYFKNLVIILQFYFIFKMWKFLLCKFYL